MSAIDAEKDKEQQWQIVQVYQPGVGIVEHRVPILGNISDQRTTVRNPPFKRRKRPTHDEDEDFVMEEGKSDNEDDEAVPPLRKIQKNKFSANSGKNDARPSQQVKQTKRVKRTVRCGKCKQEGHYTSTCGGLSTREKLERKKNTQGTKRKGTKRKAACSFCGQTGHYVPKCPEKEIINQKDVLIPATTVQPQPQLAIEGAAAKKPKIYNGVNVCEICQLFDDESTNQHETFMCSRLDGFKTQFVEAIKTKSLIVVEMDFRD